MVWWSACLVLILSLTQLLISFTTNLSPFESKLKYIMWNQNGNILYPIYTFLNLKYTYLNQTGNGSLAFYPSCSNPHCFLWLVIFWTPSTFVFSFFLCGIFCVYEKPDGSNRAEREKKLKKMGAIEYSRIYAFGMEYLREQILLPWQLRPDASILE